MLYTPSFTILILSLFLVMHDIGLLKHLDFTIMHGALGNRYCRTSDTADYLGCGREFEFISSSDISPGHSRYHNIVCGDISLPVTCRPQHQRTVKMAITFNLAVDDTVIITCQLAADIQCLAKKRRELLCVI